MTTPIEYVAQHHDRFLEELFDFLRIKSISTDPQYKGEMQRAAQWLVDDSLKIGMTRAEVFQTAGHPIVYMEWLGAKNAPTVLIYGHYDVQPAEPEDWETAPFEPVIRNGNIMARGATDDKGQLFLHLKVFETVMQTTGTFPVNIKCLFEGEEEISSVNLASFIETHKELLKADVAVVSDTAFFSEDIPAIPYGLRGLATLFIDITGPRNDLHSGMYGGSVHNPIQALCELLVTMHDENGTITVDGFYDDVRPLTPDERVQLAQIPYTEEVWRQETGAPQPWGEREYSIYERTGARPTLEIMSIKGGYLGDGTKNIVPAKATATLGCRLVPHQEPKKIYEVIRRHVEKHAPPTVKATVREHSSSPAVLIERESDAMQAAIEAYEQVCGHAPLFVLVGGSIPVVTDFQERLGIQSILIGFGLPDDNLHAPNEKLGLKQFDRGIETLLIFYNLLPQRMKK